MLSAGQDNSVVCAGKQGSLFRTVVKDESIWTLGS